MQAQSSITSDDSAIDRTAQTLFPFKIIIYKCETMQVYMRVYVPFQEFSYIRECIRIDFRILLCCLLLNYRGIIIGCTIDKIHLIKSLA